MIPCEFMVTELLPTIRKETVKFLISKNYSQREVSKMIGISEAAVSLYLKKKRGLHKKELEKIITDYIQKNYDFNRTFTENVCNLCNDFRKSGYFCKSHRIISKIPKEECKGCFINHKDGEIK
ncbi:MAG: helix-turn-helix domain-containing protein [Candidatus Micrarchaeia archaeon]